MTERDELHLLTGAYALDALSPVEKAVFEDHLDDSEELRTEVNEMADTATMLGLATTPVEPPPALKAILMALISVTPQITDTPRVLPAEAPALPSDDEQRHIRSIADGTAPTVGRAELKSRSRWTSGPLGILAVAAAAVALFAGGTALGQGLGDQSSELAQADSVVAISTAADVQRSTSDVAGGGTATLLWSDSLQRSAVKVDGLPELPEEQVYQLWYIGEAGAEGAGLLSMGDEGDTWCVLDGEMGQSTAVGVTVEPKGGSEQPTTDPIVVLDEV